MGRSSFACASDLGPLASDLPCVSFVGILYTGRRAAPTHAAHSLTHSVRIRVCYNGRRRTSWPPRADKPARRWECLEAFAPMSLCGYVLARRHLNAGALVKKPMPEQLHN